MAIKLLLLHMVSAYSATTVYRYNQYQQPLIEQEARLA